MHLWFVLHEWKQVPLNVRFSEIQNDYAEIGKTLSQNFQWLNTKLNVSERSTDMVQVPSYEPSVCVTRWMDRFLRSVEKAC